MPEPADYNSEGGLLSKNSFYIRPEIPRQIMGVLVFNEMNDDFIHIWQVEEICKLIDTLPTPGHNCATSKIQ